MFPLGCPSELRTFRSIEDGSRIAPGTAIMIPTPVFPKIDTSKEIKSDSAVTPSAIATSASSAASATSAGGVVGGAGLDLSLLSVAELSQLIAAKGAEIRDLKASKVVLM